MEWIDVNIDKPKNQDMVFLYTDKGCILTGYFHGTNSGFITYGEEAYKEIGEITHWAIPEPPKEEEICEHKTIKVPTDEYGNTHYCEKCRLWNY